MRESCSFGNGANLAHLHLRLKGRHGIVIINIFANVNVAKVAWRAVGAGTGGLEALGPSGTAANAEGWCFCSVEFSCNMLLIRNLTELFMLTWSGILIRCHSWSEESIVGR